ncbi:MAG: 16S rRNA (cytidine(1402)-2'-O)-methyltransferase [Oligoflexales bacterium]|nr:16S rRNA (cytidine(1402)-2'-O)-methyltransferase [Oligoflexales bacterium]
MSSSKIYVIASPIGNLEDLSPRAKRILFEVDWIACEDTRRARTLLSQLGTESEREASKKNQRFISYFDPVEEARADQLIKSMLEEPLSLALISDAGTPCLADPGYRLVHLARKMGIPVIPIPGPSALTCLVSASGLPSDRVLFVGFLPRKKEELKKEFSSWKRASASIVCLESATRLLASLEVLQELCPEALVCVGREMTKTYEEFITAGIEDVLSWAKGHEHLKGEVSLMISLRTKDSKDKSDDIPEGWEEKIQFLLKKRLSVRDITEFLSIESSIPRKTIYKLTLNQSEK